MNLALIVVRHFITVALIQPKQISELFIVQVKKYNSETVITTLDKNGACQNGDKYYPDIWPFIQVNQMCMISIILRYFVTQMVATATVNHPHGSTKTVAIIVVKSCGKNYSCGY